MQCDSVVQCVSVSVCQCVSVSAGIECSESECVSAVQCSAVRSGVKV